MSMPLRQKLSFQPRSVKMFTQISMGIFGIFFFALALVLDEPSEQSLVSVAESTEAKGGSAGNDEPKLTWRNY